ncbi:DUF4303 domain-containing protein [Prosthecobacter vanneervenii]|uniref:DUF4303 domain-containing protein n=1 Tax=Prosthecobacter vanneervenii TaxID=48466 RepID=A0A7W8DJ09_9BACT|nr:DUF4303 domain-containing protein [Prosthecobacter vanneervenii]MBB5031356.1 hypothetical protein [Prosthecobacter vanneervenii]
MKRIQPAHLEELVYHSIKTAFTTLISATGGQKVYVFGLFTDDGLQFLYPVANTEEALTATVQRYQTTVDPKYGCTSTRSGMRWSYGDWGFFPTVDQEAFQQVNELLSTNFEQMLEADDFDGDLELLWPAILNGFKRAEAEGFFGAAVPRDSLTLILTGDLPHTLVNQWVTTLNPPEVASKYLHWNCAAED